jgi:hypothetical protein
MVMVGTDKLVILVVEVDLLPKRWVLVSLHKFLDKVVILVVVMDSLSEMFVVVVKEKEFNKERKLLK